MQQACARVAPLLSVVFFALFATTAYAQSPEELAMFKYLEAEKAAKAGAHARCADLLEDAQEHLGATNPKLDALNARCLSGAGRYREAREAVRRYFASKPDPALLEYQELGRLAVELDEKLEQQRAREEEEARAAEETAAAAAAARERAEAEQRRAEEERRRNAEEEATAAAHQREGRRGALIAERNTSLALAASADDAGMNSGLFAVAAGFVTLVSFAALAGGLLLAGNGFSLIDEGEDGVPQLVAGLLVAAGATVAGVFSGIWLEEEWSAATLYGERASTLRRRAGEIDLELQRRDAVGAALLDSPRLAMRY